MINYRKIVSVLFAIIGLLWFHILFKAYSIIKIIDINSIDIIGGAGLSTLKYFIDLIVDKVTNLIWALEILIFLALNIIKSFKKKQTKRLNKFVIIFYVATISGCIFTRQGSYLTSLYDTFRCFGGKNVLFLVTPFVWISVAITLMAGVSLLPLKRKDTAK